MKNIILRPVLFLSALLALTAAISHAAAAARVSDAHAAKIDPALLATAGDAPVEFLIVLEEQADLSGVAELRDKNDRGRAIYEVMTATALRTQAPLRAMLDARGILYRPYWVSNMLWARGGAGLIQELATRNDVRYVYANQPFRVELPAPSPTQGSPRESDLVEWNIQIVRAPQVWAAGFIGQGAVIGGQDTGYDWQHPALINQYRGWNGSSPDHNFNWHDAIHEDLPGSGLGNVCGFNSVMPCDDDGHGTHTMGTMVGQTPELSIGMAPGAKWIGCRNMDDGVGTPATYAECYEWFIAPYPYGSDPFSGGDPTKAPHVINNSWACPPNEGCTAADILQQIVEIVRASGILTVHSAGNEGSLGCSTVSTPAAIYNASFTVGATDDQNVIAGFSSRGPVTVDGSGRLKPDIVAPGVNIHSSIPGGQYAFLSGTSMAAPHVAGLAALLISVDPALIGEVNALEEVIEQSALKRTTTENCGNDTATSVPNNVYGWGRIDALAALNYLTGFVIEREMYLPVLIP
jgi:subtilisin family serine protease